KLSNSTRAKDTSSSTTRTRRLLLPDACPLSVFVSEPLMPGIPSCRSAKQFPPRFRRRSHFAAARRRGDLSEFASRSPIPARFRRRLRCARDKTSRRCAVFPPAVFLVHDRQSINEPGCPPPQRRLSDDGFHRNIESRCRGYFRVPELSPCDPRLLKE